MPRNGFQEWWRAQINEPRRAPSSAPICPCASCFNGTGHGSTNSQRDTRQITQSTPAKRFNAFASRESVASDMVPLRSDASWASRSSLESHWQGEKSA
ncbi:hypothetical protein F4808DRAFT_460704 [Astrocystis sublimbata]|nr:hypothetical protein F4808DRAFT_460704 [Astrocystis sublimbata]